MWILTPLQSDYFCVLLSSDFQLAVVLWKYKYICQTSVGQTAYPRLFYIATES